MEPKTKLTTHTYFTASQIARELDISVATLNNWYRWYNDPAFLKPEGVPKLPEPIIMHTNGRRLWEPCNVAALLVFKTWIPKGRNGVMGAYSARFWGKKEKVIQS